MNLAELQQAIGDRLATFPALASVAVYDVVPQPSDAGDDSEFPFIVIGPHNPLRSDDKGQDGLDVLTQVHLFDRGYSAISWLGIRDAVYDALHNHGLTVSGANVYNCLFERAEDIGDPDGVTRHGVMFFRVQYFLT